MRACVGGRDGSASFSCQLVGVLLSTAAAFKATIDDDDTYDGHHHNDKQTGKRPLAVVSTPSYHISSRPVPHSSATMSLKVPKAGMNLFKDGYKLLQGTEEAVLRNITAVCELSEMLRTSFGPNGRNKLVSIAAAMQSSTRIQSTHT